MDATAQCIGLILLILLLMLSHHLYIEIPVFTLNLDNRFKYFQSLTLPCLNILMNSIRYTVEDLFTVSNMNSVYIPNLHLEQIHVNIVLFTSSILLLNYHPHIVGLTHIVIILRTHLYNKTSKIITIIKRSRQCSTHYCNALL